MACTQCRSRKLRCDREYPTCGRCLKSKVPTQCKYEDGFLWQQPTTVSTTAFASDRVSTLGMPQAGQNLHTPPDSGLGAPSIRSEALVSTTLPESAPNPPNGPRHRKHGPEKERRDCLLETGLGAPRAAINQEPYVNAGLLQRPKRAPDPQGTVSSQVGDVNTGTDSPLAPSDHLDLSPRIMMRGRETKTRFSGSGIYANLVAQVCNPC
jgi:hypothetical protein